MKVNVHIKSIYIYTNLTYDFNKECYDLNAVMKRHVPWTKLPSQNQLSVVVYDFRYFFQLFSLFNLPLYDISNFVIGSDAMIEGLLRINVGQMSNLNPKSRL